MVQRFAGREPPNVLDEFLPVFVPIDGDMIAASHPVEHIVTLTPPAELDLPIRAVDEAFLARQRPAEAYLVAAKIGRITVSNTCPTEFSFQNLKVRQNDVHAAFIAGTKEILLLGSSYMDSKHVAQPMSEDQLPTVPLEPNIEPHSRARKAGINLCEIDNRQFGASDGLDYLSATTTNLQGPSDKCCRGSNLVIQAGVRRVHAAKVIHAEGDGYLLNACTPRRGHLDITDTPAANVYLMNLLTAEFGLHTTPMQSHLNDGCGVDVSALELAPAVGLRGIIQLDTPTPSATPEILMGSERLNEPRLRARTTQVGTTGPSTSDAFIAMVPIGPLLPWQNKTHLTCAKDVVDKRFTETSVFERYLN